MKKATFVLAALALALPSGASGSPGPPALALIDPPAAAGALAPNLAQAGDVAYLTWLEPASKPAVLAERTVYRLRFAEFAGQAWSEPATIVERDDLFANWADVPSMARSTDGTLLAHWAQKSGEGTYAYDVMLARSTDAGRSWQVLGPAHDDGTQSEHGFVSFVPETAGIRAFWLDGREMAAGTAAGEHGHGDMTLRTALIADKVGGSVVLDDRVCECCSTSAVVTANGPLVVYRDRGPDEVRDISVVRLVEGRWTEPQPIHVDGWRIAGCPVNGPAVDVRDRAVAVAWYTGAVRGGAIRVAFSRDHGAGFSPPVTVDDTRPLGRVAVLLDDSGEAIVGWLDTDGAGGAIRLRRVAPDGRMGAPLMLTRASPKRTSGFPKMVRLGSRLLVVWSRVGETTRLAAVSLPLDDIPDAPGLPRSGGM
ncbi:MAG: exo-alpha-sialidase [Planctomycetota bacterium]|jgi:hypothetical protein